MVLIDYKGGATFAPFEGVPHIAGIITNLVDDPSLDRARLAACPARSSGASRC